MTIHMKNLERLSLAEMQEFVQGSRKLTLSLEGQAAIYGFIEALLKAQQYRRLSRGQRGVVRRFLTKVSGLSRAQITRLIAAWMRTRQVRRRSRGSSPPGCGRGRCGDDHPNGPIFPGGTPAPMWSCSPRWTPLTRSYPGQPPVTFWSASSASSARQSTKSCRASRFPTSTTCAVPRPIYGTGCACSTPNAVRCPLPSGANPTPKGSRLPARGYGTSGSARWPAGAVSSQGRRHRDPVGDRGLRGDHQRAAPAAGVGGHAAPVPLSHFGVSLRQRVRVHQPPGGRSAEQAVGGVHQITGLPHHRQRFSGRQEWRGRAQAYRVWTDRRAACRGTAEILHGPFQPLLELPPALWLCGQRAGGRRQKETDLSDRGLSNALRETDFAALLAAVLEGGTAPGSAATTGRPDERHRGCAADEKSQAGRVGEMPGEAVRRSDNRRLRAQGLYVLGRERGAQAPPPFPAPYPPLTGAYRKEKVSGRNATLLSRTCPGSSRIGNKLWLRAHLALESKFISRLIYGLEMLQRGLNLFRFSIVLRVQHAAYHSFAHAQTPGKLGVWYATFTHSKV